MGGGDGIRDKGSTVSGGNGAVAFLFRPAREHPEAVVTGFLVFPATPGFSNFCSTLLPAVCALSQDSSFSFSVLGSGMDPDLQMDIITELDLVNTTLGVTQVSGLHNASKALLFQGKGSSSFAGQSLGKRSAWGVLI